MNELVKAVRKHAMTHYEDGGWDYVVEAYDDADIAKAILGCKTASEAIAKIGSTLHVLDDYRKDIQAEADW